LDLGLLMLGLNATRLVIGLPFDRFGVIIARVRSWRGPAP
jgi:hypothetical protein